VAGQSSQDVLQQTVDGFAKRVSEYADGIASRLGQPLSGQQLSQDEAVQRWNFSPVGDTQAADAAYHQLVAQGTAPGQALNQVYPMRQLLIQGADINDSIARAKQIAGWAADAAGEPAPKPFEGSTMPLALAQQAAAARTPSAQLPTPPPPLQTPAAAMPQAPPPRPQVTPAPMPTGVAPQPPVS
jgi:hypothetical protein